MSPAHRGGATQIVEIEVAAAHAADLLAREIHDVFAALRVMGDALAHHWRVAHAAGDGFTSTDLAAMQEVIFDALDQQAAFDSAGFVLAEGVLTDRARHLDWWHRVDGPGYLPLVLDLDVGSPDCYDYYVMDWFDAAVTHGTRFVSGPLIDLPCAAVYVLTFSLPVMVDHALLGIAGADVALSRFENRLIPTLLEIAAPTVLVNAERRVIVSNDSQWTTGEKLRTAPNADERPWRCVVPVTEDLGWVLASADRLESTTKEST